MVFRRPGGFSRSRHDWAIPFVLERGQSRMQMSLLPLLVLMAQLVLILHQWFGFASRATFPPSLTSKLTPRPVTTRPPRPALSSDSPAHRLRHISCKKEGYVIREFAKSIIYRALSTCSSCYCMSGRTVGCLVAVTFLPRRPSRFGRPRS